MTLSELKNQIPGFARDTRLNLEMVLTSEGAPGLTERQISGAALVCAYSLNSAELKEALRVEGKVDDAQNEGALAAANIMAMNNVYYRAMHLIDDEEVKRLPARLRMNVMAKPPIDKLEFEIMSLAVSALAGCGQCLSSHAREVRKRGLSAEGVQSVIRIAAVMNAVTQALRAA